LLMLATGRLANLTDDSTTSRRGRLSDRYGPSDPGSPNCCKSYWANFDKPDGYW
jgi:hypothetical protein